MTLVLLGDPQQLEQPMKGVHPEATGASALDHVLGGKPTIGEDEGLFLDETWRLHPEICRFTSELFYEGRLHSRPGLDIQTVGSSSRSALQDRCHLQMATECIRLVHASAVRSTASMEARERTRWAEVDVRGFLRTMYGDKMLTSVGVGSGVR